MAERYAIGGIRGDVSTVATVVAPEFTMIYRTFQQEKLEIGSKISPVLTTDEMRILEWLTLCQRDEAALDDLNGRLRTALIWYAKFLSGAGAKLPFRIVARRANSERASDIAMSRLKPQSTPHARSSQLSAMQVKLLRLLQTHGTLKSREIFDAGIPRRAVMQLLKRDLLHRLRASEYSATSHALNILALRSPEKS
jgi:hypothetical protein